jgi:hypothetical protein
LLLVCAAEALLVVWPDVALVVRAIDEVVVGAILVVDTVVTSAGVVADPVAVTAREVVVPVAEMPTTDVVELWGLDATVVEMEVTPVLVIVFGLEMEVDGLVALPSALVVALTVLKAVVGCVDDVDASPLPDVDVVATVDRTVVDKVIEDAAFGRDVEDVDNDEAITGWVVGESILVAEKLVLADRNVVLVIDLPEVVLLAPAVTAVVLLAVVEAEADSVEVGVRVVYTELKELPEAFAVVLLVELVELPLPLLVVGVAPIGRLALELVVKELVGKGADCEVVSRFVVGVSRFVVVVARFVLVVSSFVLVVGA